MDLLGSYTGFIPYCSDIGVVQLALSRRQSGGGNDGCLRPERVAQKMGYRISGAQCYGPVWIHPVGCRLGCRIGDIINLSTDSVIDDGGIYKLNIVEQKTGKRRNFIVPKPVKKLMDDYMADANINHGPLFDIKAPAVWKQLRAVTAYLGLDNISTHSFRKMAACNLYEATGHDIEAVCEFLNHSSTNTTRKYIKRSDAQLESAIEKCVEIV